MRNNSTDWQSTTIMRNTYVISVAGLTTDYFWRNKGNTPPVIGYTSNALGSSKTAVVSRGDSGELAPVRKKPLNYSLPRSSEAQMMAFELISQTGIAWFTVSKIYKCSFGKSVITFWEVHSTWLDVWRIRGRAGRGHEGDRVSISTRVGEAVGWNNKRFPFNWTAISQNWRHSLAWGAAVREELFLNKEGYLGSLYKATNRL